MAYIQPRNYLMWMACVAALLEGSSVKGIQSNLYYPDSTFFSTSFQPYYSTLNVRESDGDLWPTTWADNDVIYAANGDGRGFSTNPDDFRDALVNRIFGTPETGITGERLAAGDELGPIWADETLYNRKPTGIIAVDGDGDGKDELYLVIQALNYSPDGNRAFNDIPAASILRSTDYGITWTPTGTPMFSDYIFKTVWLLYPSSRSSSEFSRRTVTGSSLLHTSRPGMLLALLVMWYHRGFRRHGWRSTGETP